MENQNNINHISKCKELTQEQLNQTNGCGSSFWLFWLLRIPKWFSQEFYCACCCHDLRFTNGEALEQKYEADDKLYDDMYYSAFHDKSKIMKLIKLKVADITYYFLNTQLSNIAYKKAKPKKFYFN